MSIKFILILFLNYIFFELIKTELSIPIIEKYSKTELNSREAILITRSLLIKKKFIFQ